MKRSRITAVAIVAGVFVARMVCAATTITCLTGTDPSVAGDVARITAARAAIDAVCICAHFDGSSRKTHSSYVTCTSGIIKALVPANLRSQCAGTVKSFYAKSSCGVNPALHAAPCIKIITKTGAIGCSIKNMTRRDGVTPTNACRDTASSHQVACPAYTTCIDAADTDHDFLIGPDETGQCVPTPTPTNTPTPTCTGTPTQKPVGTCATYTESASGDDGYMYGGSQYPTYPPPSEFYLDTAGNDLIVERTIAGGREYFVDLSLVRFTNTLPANAILTSATLQLYLIGSYDYVNTDNFTIGVEWYDNSNWPISAAAYTTGYSNSAGQIAVNALAMPSYNNFALTPLSNIIIDGTNGFLVTMSGGTPTGTNHVTFTSWDYGLSYPYTTPQLQLCYTLATPTSTPTQAPPPSVGLTNTPRP